MTGLRAALLSHPALHALGWTLLHSLWQGALVALGYAAAETALRHSSARARYAAACLSLLLLVALPAATFSLVRSSDAAASGARATGAGAVPAGASSEDRHARAGEPSAHPLALSPSPEESADDAAPGGLAAGWAAALLPWLGLAWLVCVAGLLARLAGGWALNRRVWREAAASPVGGAWQARVERLAREVRVSRPVRLCRSALVEVPAVVGWLRPVILVPAAALEGLSGAQLEAVLAHELAHVRRHDYLVNLLQSLAETLLFYHPAAHWLSRRVRAEREHVCDDLAVEATGDAITYARALVALEELRRRTCRTPQFALAADGGSLRHRVQRLLLAPRRTRQPPRPYALGAAAAFAAALLVCAHALAVGPGGGRGAAGLDGSPASRARRRVAVTFVSLPMIHAADAPRAERDTRRLLASLRAHNVPAVGFVSGQQLYVNGRQDEARVALLRQWLDAGVELGAEGFSHPNLFDTPPQEFRRDVLRGESVTAQLAAERGQTRLRYFSYPFLNVGPDRETKEAFERFLALRGMQIHKVTIDNLDWLFGKVYADALRRGDGAAMRRVEGEYVAYMERVFDFYERLSRDTVGREIPQVLMLTANALNCAKFDDLAAMLERRGYAFVTLEEAQGDPAYAQPDTYTGPWGISWLQRWAMARGAGFRDEPYLSPYMEQFDTYTKKWQGIKVNESK